MKLKLLKKKIKFSHSKWSMIDPEHHWHTSLLLALILVLLSFSFGAYLFMKERKALNSLTLEGDKVVVDTISYTRIKKVLDMFYEREKTSQEIINSPSAFSDPSI